MGSRSAGSGPSRHRSWVAIGLAVIAVGLVAWASGRSAAVVPRPKLRAVAIEQRLASGERHAQDESESLLLEVQAIVDSKNAALEDQRRAFAADGWTFVDAPAADPALTSASPDLLPSREAEIRAQLLSAPPGRDRLENVAAIAVRASESETRVAAVEAIARMGAGEPQRALLSVMGALDPSDPARRALVPLLRPASTADPIALELITLLDARWVTSDEKDQIALTIVLVVAGEGGELPSELVFAMSVDATARIDRMTLLARRMSVLARNER